MSKWIGVVLVALGFLASALAAARIPVMVPDVSGALFPFLSGAASEPAPRWLVLWLLPSIALLAWLLLQLLVRPAGEPIARAFLVPRAPTHITTAEHVARFAPTLHVISAGVVLLLLAFHGSLLLAALGHATLAGRLLAVIVGLAFVVIGNVMPRLRPNVVAGVRTRRTLSDPDLWRTTHRVFGAALVVTGVVTIALGVFGARWTLVVALACLLLSCLIGGMASVVAGRRGAVRTIVLLALAACCAPRPTLAQSPAAPVAPATVREAAFEFASGTSTLSGTLTLPATDAVAPVPVAVIVAGSGPTDRNGNGPLVNTNTYAQLAWSLAERGIASLRYDKRGMSPGAPVGDLTAVTLDVYVEDASAAARAMRADPRFGAVIAIGHSEGAGLVLQAANRGAPFDRVVMIAGLGRGLREALSEQFSRQADAATVERADSAFAQFLRGETPTDPPPVAAPVLLPMYRRFLQSMAEYDAPAEAARLRQPLLLVYGETDIQATLEDARRIAEARPSATLVVLEETNHLLKHVPTTDLAAQRPTYNDPTLPIVAEAPRAIADWILSDPGS